MDKLGTTISKIAPLHAAAMEECQYRLDTLTKPKSSLGLLEAIAVRLAGITGDAATELKKKTHVIMAADHGIAAEGVSAYPQEVTAQMVLNFLTGGAAINVLAQLNGAAIVCVDMGIASEVTHPDLLRRKIKYGTDNMTLGPAMTRDEAIRSVETGITVAEAAILAGASVISVGEMGIGNTSASSAIAAVLVGGPPERFIGRGTGVDATGFSLKTSAILKAIRVNRPDPADPVDVLAKVGGLEIGGIAGLILGAAARRIPIVTDGFISAAAALLAVRLAPAAAGYLFASHLSEEPGHRLVLAELGLTPFLHLRMRLGEGSGAVMALPVLAAAGEILRGMATFESAGISGANRQE